jgi:hypothetical protein
VQEVVSTADAMGVPGPDALPPGPLRTLTEALHELRRAAGRPSAKRVAQAVAADRRLRDDVSQREILDMLRGVGLARWSKVECVVSVLIRLTTPPRDLGEHLSQFKTLWDAVAAVNIADAPVPPTVGARVRSLFVLGGVTGGASVESEMAALDVFGRRLGNTIARAGVDLVACSPFPDSLDYYTLVGYFASDSRGTVHMHRPRHAYIESKVEELRETLGVAATEQMKDWFYPGPETDGPDAIGQAWVLCQLMAMEQADVVVTLGGKLGKTASTILHMAEVRRKPIIPFGFLGGAAERAFQRRDWSAGHPWLDTGTLMSADAAGDVVTIAERMVVRRVRRLNERLGPPTAAFISRAWIDRDYARALDDFLRTTGVTVLFGEGSLPADRTVETAIEDAVLRSDLFIVLWSRSYAASRYCYDELDLALRRFRAGELRLWIISVDGSDPVPPDARDVRSIPAKTPDAVVAAVRALLAEVD